jgi:hypothetical protein
VVSRPGGSVLAKGIAIAFALRLAAKHHRDAESVIITWIEHQQCFSFRIHGSLSGYLFNPGRVRQDLMARHIQG